MRHGSEPTLSAMDVIEVCGSVTGNGSAAGTNDFDMNFSHGANGDLAGSNASCTTSGTATRFFATSTTVENNFVAATPDVASAVPEPASWAMMIGGFGVVGGAMRRRGTRRAPRVSVAV